MFREIGRPVVVDDDDIDDEEEEEEDDDVDDDGDDDDVVVDDDDDVIFCYCFFIAIAPLFASECSARYSVMLFIVMMNSSPSKIFIIHPPPLSNGMRAAEVGVMGCGAAEAGVMGCGAADAGVMDAVLQKLE